MDPPSRSPALNPASTPFFPGAMRLNDEAELEEYNLVSASIFSQGNDME